jgi:hypothetical protein
MIDCEQYFKVGQSNAGDLHATAGLWGPALCDQPLITVNDNRQYSADELLSIDLCSLCHAVARMRTNPAQGVSPRLAV